MGLLLPTPMTRMVIAGPRTVERKVVDALYKARALHIKDYTPPEGEQVFRLGTPMEGGEKASGLLIKLRSFKAALGLENVPAPDAPMKVDEVLAKLEASVVALEMSITGAADDRGKLEAEAAELRARIEELRPFETLPTPLDLLGGYGALAVFTGFVREGFEGRLKDAVKSLDIVGGSDPAGAVAVFVDRESRDAAMKVLLDAGFQEARVPKGTRSALEEIRAAEAELKDSIQPKLDAKKEELDALKEKHAPFILAAAEVLEMEVERCEAPLRGAHSPNTFVLEGFVPSARVEALRRELEGAAGGRVHVEAEEVPQLAPPAPHGGHGEHHGAGDHHVEAGLHGEVPVALTNPKVAGAFEYLTNLISLPKYGEVDPTLLMFFVFPVFFGIMLGDIGYGIAVMFLGHLAARTKSTDLVAVGRLLRMGGLMSFLFGFVFGEFFGFEVFGSHPGAVKFWAHDIFVPALVGVLGFDGYFPISRLHSVPFLLSVTIWVGIIHIFAGMVLGFRNQLRQAGFAHAMFAKGSWIIILVSGVLWVRAMTGAMFGGGDLGAVAGDPSFLAGLGLFMVGVVLLLKGEGGVGAVELPSLLGNILSYSRLLAIGLSGVAIALTANLPIEWAMEAGGAAWAVAIPLGVLGHLLGIFLGMLGPGLHALRLHYVEFFTKFYQGGGRPFAPLGKEAKYTAP
jgi:V/A-type H+-transporting ATPase subunit I